MHSRTPHDPRPYDSSAFEDPAPMSDRGDSTGRWRSMAVSMLFAALLLAAIIALITLI